MTALASRAYAHRSRNGFLIALWMAKNNLDAFSCLGGHASKIVLAMLESQADQKLGRRPKFKGVITGSQATLVRRIQDAKPDDQETLLRHTCEFGLDLVTGGFVSILPDDELKGWKLVLSPEGELLAKQLSS